MSVSDLKHYGNVKAELRMKVEAILSENLAQELLDEIYELFEPLLDKKYLED